MDSMDDRHLHAFAWKWCFSGCEWCIFADKQHCLVVWRRVRKQWTTSLPPKNWSQSGVVDGVVEGIWWCILGKKVCRVYMHHFLWNFQQFKSKLMNSCTVRTSDGHHFLCVAPWYLLPSQHPKYFRKPPFLVTSPHVTRFAWSGIWIWSVACKVFTIRQFYKSLVARKVSILRHSLRCCFSSWFGDRRYIVIFSRSNHMVGFMRSFAPAVIGRFMLGVLGP